VQSAGQSSMMRRTAAFEAWWPLLLLLATAIVFGSWLTPWKYMWVLALAIFAGCKWLTWRRFVRMHGELSPARTAGYLLTWPGMDPRPFSQCAADQRRSQSLDWLGATAAVSVGAATFWLIPGVWLSESHPFTPWFGIAGVVLMLHFGMFRALAVGWRCVGVAVEPLMRSPVQARSLRDFWGQRWNRGFRDFAHAFVFRPLAARYAIAPATWAVFLFSGLVHDVVISLPAGAGYGLPTCYFALQAVGMRLERTNIGRQIGLNNPVIARVFAAAVIVMPMPILFHHAFRQNVILEMMRAGGALN